jgi:hypothetical protein
MTRVASLVTDWRFLDGSHCIEFIWCPQKQDDAYSFMQVACCNLRQQKDDPPMLVERHRNFGTVSADPLPAWRAFLGNGSCKEGFYGSCTLSLQWLLEEAWLVALAVDDRVPPEEALPGKPDRFAAERNALKAVAPPKGAPRSKKATR